MIHLHHGLFRLQVVVVRSDDNRIGANHHMVAQSQTTATIQDSPGINCQTVSSPDTVGVADADTRIKKRGSPKFLEHSPVEPPPYYQGNKAGERPQQPSRHLLNPEVRKAHSISFGESSYHMHVRHSWRVSTNFANNPKAGNLSTSTCSIFNASLRAGHGRKLG